MKKTNIWLIPKKQKLINSASELGLEVLSDQDFDLVRLQGNWASLVKRALIIKRQKGWVYFQFGSPVENLFCAFLVLLGVPVIAHYLDQIAEGYPKWAKTLKLHQIIYFILKNATVILAISPAMKTEIAQQHGRTNSVFVKFRTVPDCPMPVGNKHIEFTNSVVFTGNVNSKTNLHGLIEANHLLRQNNLKLVILTRTESPDLLEYLRSQNIEVRPPVAPEQVVFESSRYAAQIIAFNKDQDSQSFYRVSTPSKMPNLFMAGRKILYFGPQSFWLGSWLQQFPDLTINVADLTPETLRSQLSVTPERSSEILLAFGSLCDTIPWSEF